MSATNTESAEKRVITYDVAGVDIAAGDRLVELIKPFCKGTYRSGCDGEIGGFGGVFDLKKAGWAGEDTVLVAGDDGVGTKVKLAFDMNKHDTVGIDLVAMSVNDLVVQNAEPLFFLDYYACGHLDVEVAKTVIEGICKGCQQAKCALIGGETAEMPDMYAKGEYDLAGFAVGAVKRSEIMPRPTAPGMIVLGLASTGVHSNGYSLVRKLVAASGLSLSDSFPKDTSKTLGQVLIEPTRIYVQSLLAACKTEKVVAMAHITGGGLVENIPRVLGENTGVTIKAGTWPVLPVFKWLQEVGNVPQKEMVRTFNCGIGMVVVVKSEEDVAEVTKVLEEHGETVYRIGEVTSIVGSPEVTIEGNLF
ncbi:hypothetical protein WA158_002789 [Blastocystis sp. Blastoise]